MLMWTPLRLGIAALLFICVSLPGVAWAITAEVAKKCQILLAKEFPPRQLGNPAAGSSKGSFQVQREYFNKCVANGGSMDDSSEKNTK